MPRSFSSDTAPTFGRGLKSAITLAIVCSVAMAIGVGLAHFGKKAEQTKFETRSETDIAPQLPALSETLLSAEDFTDARSLQTISGTLKSRDTLFELLVRMGADGGDADAALRQIYQKEFIDARKLRPGMTLDATFEDIGDELSLTGLSLRATPDQTVVVTRNSSGDGWTAAGLKAKVTPSYKRVATTIDTSIYDAALKLGAGDQQVVDFAKIFAYDIDFQREIYPGDEFEILYEAWVDERGNPVSTGEVLYAELNGKALKRGFYRHTPSDDEVMDYFDAKGESATKFLMKTPINGARLSSSFGRRRHPISGYTRLHKGTDFAARTGTPVYAAGHGVVERASRYGGYGNYVRIRHANGYKTAYAHLSRYGNIRTGRRVRQGDVIGYVGSTGASTGPHLHYEVMINGKHVNAMSLKLPTGRKLSGDMLDEFTVKRSEIDALRLNQGAELEMAAATSLPTLSVR